MTEQAAFTYAVFPHDDSGGDWMWEVTYRGRLLARGRAVSRAEARTHAIATALSHDERSLDGSAGDSKLVKV
jgi:hypothetical protein